MELFKAIMLMLHLLNINPIADTPVNQTLLVKPPPKLDTQRLEQLSCLRVAVYREARDQPIEGQRAVVQVILRRAIQNNKRVCQVVYQRINGYCQFSYACDAKQRSINLKRLSRYDLKAYRIVDRISSQEYKKWESGVKPSNASHFKRCDSDNSGFNNLKFLFQLGHHCFYSS